MDKIKDVIFVIVTTVIFSLFLIVIGIGGSIKDCTNESVKETQQEEQINMSFERHEIGDGYCVLVEQETGVLFRI